MLTYLKLSDLFLNSTDLCWYQAETVQLCPSCVQPVQHFLHIKQHFITDKFSTPNSTSLKVTETMMSTPVPNSSAESQQLAEVFASIY